MQQSQTEIRTDITNKIIESLKKGKIPWRKTWSGMAGPRTPHNFTTKRAYSGINIPILWLAGSEHGFNVDYWATFNQWKSAGASVKKGEKATQIVFFKPIKKTVKDEFGNDKIESFPLLRTFPVFNIHQVQGKIVEPFLDRPAGPAFEHSNRVEFDQMVGATGAEVRYGGAKAVYYPLPGDFIKMPNESDFENFPAFAETLAHELSHWSEHRLNWTGSYAEGELRAEMAAVFTMAASNIPDSNNLENHAAYLGAWLEALQNDHKFLFRAAAAASKSADFLLSFSNANQTNEQIAEIDAEAASV
jgi:antirestriction protein ArdC